MKTCCACGKDTNLLIGLGGVLLCRDKCYPQINAEVEQLRRDNKPVDVTAIAWRKRQEAGMSQVREG